MGRPTDVRAALAGDAGPHEATSKEGHMTTAQIIGTAATVYGFGASTAMLLQVRQLLARGSSCDVSAAFLTSYVGGYAIWLLYGISIGSLPIILVHAVGLGTGGLTLAVALALRGSLVRPSTWRSCPVEVAAGEGVPE
jgi:uncharacterized protein with PQ loop repeat